MNTLLRILVPVGILGACAGVILFLVATKPEPPKRPPQQNVLTVDAIRLAAEDYRISVWSYGTVSARTRSILKPQVDGMIMNISPNFRQGGFFEVGELLMEIDPEDYQTALKVAEATLRQKEAELEIEKAQHAQAMENWEQLGDQSQPSPLVLREPQLNEALADVESARSRVMEAQRNLARTKIRAPYVGRILRKDVDEGQYVTRGNILAEIFAIDYVEVRIPLQDKDLDFVELPRDYRGETGVPQTDGSPVILHGQFGTREVMWEGRIVRVEGAYDPQTRQLFVVVQVDDPYRRTQADAPPLRVGQYVRAQILGKRLPNVFVLPVSALRQGNEVLVVDENKRLQRREVDPIWATEEYVIIHSQLRAGEVVCVTPLMFAANGVEVIARIPGDPTRLGQDTPVRPQKSNGNRPS